MNNFETELIDAWLKTNGFLTRVGLPSIEGARSIIASRIANGISENLHIENKVRFIANAYLCGSPINMAERSEEEIKQEAIQFVDKLYTNERVVQARDRIIVNGGWIFVLVIGEVRSIFEVEYLKELGIQVIDFKELANQAINNRSRLGSLSEMKRTLSVINYIKD